MEPQEESGKLRLFVAIDLAPSLKNMLTDLQKKLKPFARDAKWVNPEGIHLTLKFLGYVDQEKVPEIEKILASAAQSFSPVQVQASGIGYFPNSRRPNVLWVGIQSSNLGPIQKKMEDDFVPIGFEKENRPFSPHLTLARFRDPHGLLPLTQQTERLKDSISETFTADSFSLYRSILRRQGAEYSVIRSFRLSGPSPEDAK